MTNPIDQLEKLDRQRARLSLYEARLNRLFFAKSLRDRQLRRVQKAWLRINNERQHLYSLIMASSALREQLKERERLQQARAPVLSSKTSEVEDHDIGYHALETVRCLYAERQAKNAYQDAVWFYKRGDWRHLNISSADLDRLIDAFRQDVAMVLSRRLKAQHAFETAARRFFGDDPDHIFERDLVLSEATEYFQKNETVPQNAFTVWLDARGLKPPQPKKKLRLKM